jgi:hypothetical protein
MPAVTGIANIVRGCRLGENPAHWLDREHCAARDSVFDQSTPINVRFYRALRDRFLSFDVGGSYVVTKSVRRLSAGPSSESQLHEKLRNDNASHAI